MGSWTERRRHILEQEDSSDTPGGQGQVEATPNTPSVSEPVLVLRRFSPSASLQSWSFSDSGMFGTHCSGALTASGPEGLWEFLPAEQI